MKPTTISKAVADLEEKYPGLSRYIDVTWSVSVSTKRRSFSAPRIESIQHIKTSWD
jgi:hypothetical protein